MFRNQPLEIQLISLCKIEIGWLGARAPISVTAMYTVFTSEKIASRSAPKKKIGIRVVFKNTGVDVAAS